VGLKEEMKRDGTYTPAAYRKELQARGWSTKHKNHSPRKKRESTVEKAMRYTNDR
jgi:hypothetical protein